MHEMAYCTEVVDTVIAEATRVNAVSVDRVDIMIGEVRDIVVDLFDGFFHYLAKDTIADNAVVSYQRVPVTVTCRCCGLQYPVNVRNKQAFACPSCGKTEYDVTTGMEFEIVSIDVTTEDDLMGIPA